MENAKSNGNSKLRGTETSTNSRIQYTPASSFQTHSSASSQNTVENTLMVSKHIFFLILIWFLLSGVYRGGGVPTRLQLSPNSQVYSTYYI